MKRFVSILAVMAMAVTFAFANAKDTKKGDKKEPKET